MKNKKTNKEYEEFKHSIIWKDGWDEAQKEFQKDRKILCHQTDLILKSKDKEFQKEREKLRYKLNKSSKKYGELKKEFEPLKEMVGHWTYKEYQDKLIKKGKQEAQKEFQKKIDELKEGSLKYLHPREVKEIFDKVLGGENEN